MNAPTFKFKDEEFTVGSITYLLTGTYSPPTKPDNSYPGDDASLNIDVVRYLAPEGYVTITELWNALNLYERFFSELYQWAFRNFRLDFYNPTA